MRIKQHMAENIQNYHVECAKLIHINTWEKCRGISSRRSCIGEAN